VRLVAEVQRVQHAIAQGILPPDAQGPRLMVFMPPRHGKSELISRYTPAWFLGTNPDLRVILAGYGTTFAGTWGRKARDVLEEVGPALFQVHIDPRSSKADDWNIDGRRGGMLSTGVGGTITGYGAHLLVVDDPVKNAEEARSEVMQEKTATWWRETARTRMMPGAGAIVLQTRWHELDLSGQLLANDPSRDEQGRKLPEGQTREGVDGEEWDVLCLPGIAGEDDGYGMPDELGRQPGEALWPQMYPTAQLELLRRAIGRYGFSAQFQQTPTPDEGGIFKRADFRYYRLDEHGEGRGDVLLLDDHAAGVVKRVGWAWLYRFATVDTATSEKETADYSVMAHWAVTPDRDLVLLDVERHHFEDPELRAFILRTKAAWQVSDVRIEEKAAGQAVVQGLTRAGHAIRPLKADTDKVTRAMGAVPRYEAHTVFHPLAAPWLAKYERELLAFPNGSHDDQVDVFAYAALALPAIPVLGRANAPAAEGPSVPSTVHGGVRARRF
jgi:predicted phage terminase large subunit-like protein